MFRTEQEFVRWLRGLPSQKSPRVRLGIGDDAALVTVTPGDELILTSDLSLEGVHFHSSLHPPHSVGHRALARSLSDIAAMGGTPRFVLLSLALSRRARRAWIEEFYRGVRELAARFRVRVVGGDTAVISGATAIDVTVAGEVTPGRALRRSGARPGDWLFVSGRLGLSALGLDLLRTRGKGPRGNLSEPIRTHLYPEPRCALGRFLSKKQLATALIDLSDGFSTDLARLCSASGVGARVFADRLPEPIVPSKTKPVASRLLDLALHGGEDYELLFTVPARKGPQIPARFRGVPLHCLGEVRTSKDLLLLFPDGAVRRLRPFGYDHFAQATGGK